MFIAMRLVDGPSLADLIDTNSISGREALRVVGAIASALDAAHDAGLVHRDIKPQNILLTRAGHPYLADFGITKGTDHGDLTHSGDFVGSLNYVAPEQIDGSDVTGASDIYSLTAVLFHCLSGLHPYERESDAALMHAHLTAPAPTLSERGIVAPPALDEVFRIGMAKVPAQRYATATELVEACRRALALVEADALERYPAFAAQGAPSWSAPIPEPVAPTTEPDQFAWATAPPVAPVDVPMAQPPYPEPALPQPVLPEAAGPAQRDLTAADFRRAFTDRPQEPPRSRSVSPEVLGGLALLLLVLAPVSGYALGDGGGSPPAPKRVSSAALTLEHDASWAPTRAGITGLELTQAVTLRHSDGVKLAAGRLPTFALGFDPVPPALRKRFAGRTQDATIRLGGATASRHAVALDSGGRLWLALVPDSKGWIAVACEGPGADRDSACPAVAATLTIRGASAVPLGPSKQVATSIGAAIDDLNRARKSAARPLRSASLDVRAHALGRVAAAHTRVANILTGLRVRPQEGPLVAGLADALRAQSPKLVALATATTRRRRADYDSARAGIRRQDRRVTTALRRLRSIGYDAS
jgi:hypothetical protein